MAHGHPDYWKYSAPQLAVPGPEQTPVYLENQLAVAAGATVAAVTYTVLANERLYIAGGMVTCDGPGTQACSVRALPAAAQRMYFDTALVLPFNPSALRVYEATRIVTIEVTNLAAVAHNFGVMLIGFRVAIVPGTPPLPALEAGLGLAITGAGV